MAHNPSKQQKPTLPIILYEEPKPGEPANPIPYIEIKKDEQMPKILFISEYKETGEFEPDTNVGTVAIVDMLIHKFVDLEHLKDKLDEQTYDKIRVSLGMKPLKEAQALGQPILDKALKAAEDNKRDLVTNKDKRAARAFTLGQDLKIKSERFLKENKEN